MGIAFHSRQTCFHSADIECCGSLTDTAAVFGNVLSADNGGRLQIGADSAVIVVVRIAVCGVACGFVERESFAGVQDRAAGRTQGKSHIIVRIIDIHRSGVMRSDQLGVCFHVCKGDGEGGNGAFECEAACFVVTVEDLAELFFQLFLIDSHAVMTVSIGKFFGCIRVKGYDMSIDRLIVELLFDVVDDLIDRLFIHPAGYNIVCHVIFERDFIRGQRLFLTAVAVSVQQNV